MLLCVLRCLIFVVPLTVVLGILMDYDLSGVWSGISIGNWLATGVAIVMSLVFFKKVEAGRVYCPN